jgi:hypothetical protein
MAIARLPYEVMRLNPPSWGFWAGRSPARAPRSGAGGGAGGGTPPPQRFLRSCWAGEGLWAHQEGKMGQKWVCFGLLRPARFRQDESKEVHEVGSKRPSSGCNGVHVLSLYPLIWRSLTRVSVSPQPPQDGRWAIFAPVSYKNMALGDAGLEGGTVPWRPTRIPGLAVGGRAHTETTVLDQVKKSQQNRAPAWGSCKCSSGEGKGGG